MFAPLVRILSDASSSFNIRFASSSGEIIVTLLELEEEESEDDCTSPA